MNVYYNKIRNKSISTIILGIGMIVVGGYMSWNYTLGANAHAKDHTAIALLFAAGVLLGAYVLYASFRSVQILKKNMKKLGVSESEVAEDLNQGYDYAKCNVGKRYALKCSGRPDVVVLEGALVVYPEIHVTNKNGYSYYNYQVFVTERSGKEKYLDAEDEAEMGQIVNRIMEIVPYAITQNDNVVQELRKKNLAELVRIVEERKANYNNELSEEVK